MPDLSQHEARQIVYHILANYTGLSLNDLDDHLRVKNILLDSRAEIFIHRAIVGAVKSKGYPTVFSLDDIHEAERVGDIVLSLVEGTDSPGPKFRP
jgi:hypothetical protein